MQTILITGASGYVGSHIYKFLKNQNYNVVGFYNKNRLFEELIHVDITNKQELQKTIEKVNPSVIIHTAADAHTGTCEKDPEKAKHLNVESTRNIAVIAKRKGIRVIHVSTFACYNPSNVYGKTKLEAENIIKELNDYVILRFSLCVGLSPNTEGVNFYNDLMKTYKANLPIEADSEWVFEMTYLGSVSFFISDLLKNQKISNVTIPISNKGETTRYKIALDLLKDKGVTITEVKKGFNVSIPRFDDELYKKFGLTRHKYQESIERMKEELIK